MYENTHTQVSQQSNVEMTYVVNTGVVSVCASERAQEKEGGGGGGGWEVEINKLVSWGEQNLVKPNTPSTWRY